jgi:di/tricarboxylate transporter
VKDPRSLENYARGGATDAEIAAILVLPVKAIEVFEPVLAKARALLAHRIRGQLLQAADKAEPTALSWLATEYLR